MHQKISNTISPLTLWFVCPDVAQEITSIANTLCPFLQLIVVTLDKPQGWNIPHQISNASFALYCLCALFVLFVCPALASVTDVTKEITTGFCR